MRAIALIDGEHYPPVVRFALERLSAEYEVVAAVFIGGTEKVDRTAAESSYGVPLVTSPDRGSALADALARFIPDVVIDLSDEPVLTSADRMSLASIVLAHGAEYRGADFAFTPPVRGVVTATPTIAVIGTGKRVGKTAISAYIARYLKSRGTDLVVLAMGRGGPAEPEIIRGDEVALTTDDLLALARQGVHAASDNYEDAIMSRVTTVGCRRCGGGMAGATYISNVEEGARLADSLGKDLMIVEGSGAAIPPVAADATVLVVGAAQGVPYVRDFFGPYRLSRADAAVIAGAEEPLSSAADRSALIAAIRILREDIPVVPVTFRPRPLADVRGARVFFATTAPEALVPVLSRHLEVEYGCEVVATCSRLSDRTGLRESLSEHAGNYDLLLTELKAAAIDVVAAAGAEGGVPTVLCDNEPISVDGGSLPPVIEHLVKRAGERHEVRSS